MAQVRTSNSISKRYVFAFILKTFRLLLRPDSKLIRTDAFQHDPLSRPANSHGESENLESNIEKSLLKMAEFFTSNNLDTIPTSFP